MSLASVSKAIGGAIAAGVAGSGTLATAVNASTIFPPGTDVPWWGYLIAFAASSVLGYVVTYMSPKNTPS